MKTYLLRDSLKKVSSINQQLTHAFFIGEQFLIDNSEYIVNESDSLTSTFFSTNSHKEKFNVRLGEIEKIYDEYQDFLLSSSFVYLYSIFEQYQKDMLSLSGKIKNTNCSRLENISLIESMFICVGSLMNNFFSQGEIDTVDYIRLRRNCLVHADGNPSEKLLRLIGNNGGNINTTWQALLEIESLDFTSNHIEKFSVDEILEAIRIIRYLMSKTDEEVLKIIGRENIISFGLTEFRQTFADKVHNRNRNRLETMFSRFIQDKFSIDKNTLNLDTITF